MIMSFEVPEDHGVSVPRENNGVPHCSGGEGIARYGWQSVMDWRGGFQIPRPDV